MRLSLLLFLFYLVKCHFICKCDVQNIKQYIDAHTQWVHTHVFFFTHSKFRTQHVLQQAGTLRPVQPFHCSTSPFPPGQLSHTPPVRSELNVRTLTCAHNSGLKSSYSLNILDVRLPSQHCVRHVKLVFMVGTCVFTWLWGRHTIVCICCVCVCFQLNSIHISYSTHHPETNTWFC